MVQNCPYGISTAPTGFSLRYKLHFSREAIALFKRGYMNWKGLMLSLEIKSQHSKQNLQNLKALCSFFHTAVEVTVAAEKDLEMEPMLLVFSIGVTDLGVYR